MLFFTLFVSDEKREFLTKSQGLRIEVHFIILRRKNTFITKGFNMSRIIALIIMLIPGFISAFGIKLMRDMVFGILQPPIPNLLLQFILGFLFFAAGLAFIAGFILHRDRKKNKVQAIFRIPDSSKKQNRP
jgi:hypothetical protein